MARIFRPGNGEKLTISSTFRGDAARVEKGTQMELLGGSAMLIVRVRFDSFCITATRLRNSLPRGGERDRYIWKRVRKFVSECCRDGEGEECLRTVLHEAMREGGWKAGIALSVERAMNEPGPLH